MLGASQVPYLFFHRCPVCMLPFFFYTTILASTWVCPEVLLTPLTNTNIFQRAPSSLTRCWCRSTACLTTFTTRPSAGTSTSGTPRRAAPAGTAAWSSAASPCSSPAASTSSAAWSSSAAPPRRPAKVCIYWVDISPGLLLLPYLGKKWSTFVLLLLIICADWGYINLLTPLINQILIYSSIIVKGSSRSLVARLLGCYPPTSQSPLYPFIDFHATGYYTDCR